MGRIDGLFEVAARLERAGVIMTRVGLVVVLAWIGGLKAYHYEDEGIVPMVANSPLDELLLSANRPGSTGGT